MTLLALIHPILSHTGHHGFENLTALFVVR
jgi:hypothetical protein